jgi:Sigma-70 region 2
LGWARTDGHRSRLIDMGRRGAHARRRRDPRALVEHPGDRASGSRRPYDDHVGGLAYEEEPVTPADTKPRIADNPCEGISTLSSSSIRSLHVCFGGESKRERASRASRTDAGARSHALYLETVQDIQVLWEESAYRSGRAVVGELVLRELLRKGYPPLVRLLYGITADLWEAEDLAQEAMSRTWERWADVGKMDSPSGSPRTSPTSCSGVVAFP